mgnify:CR=1 FL=1
MGGERARSSRQSQSAEARRRESANARGVWRDHVLPFLLDASAVVPEGW